MSETMTIQDGLTELKRIHKLLETRRDNIRRYSSKKRGNKDEIEKQQEFVNEQFQSAKDLLQRYLNIKLAINVSNLSTIIVFKGKEFSVAEGILFKQRVYQAWTQLYESFSPSTGLSQISEFRRNIGGLTAEQLEKLDFVPELLYDEKEILKLKEENLDLYAYIDALIDKSNHATTIEI